MLKSIYKCFNEEQFSAEKYRQLRADIFNLAGDTVLRMCETPVFVTPDFSGQMVNAAIDIVQQALEPAIQKKMTAAVLPEFKMPHAPERPSFFIIDFAVCKDKAEKFTPRLIEMQAFASNTAFAPMVMKLYKDTYKLDGGFSCFLSPKDENEYIALFKRTILGNHAPENTVLMEINPWQQAQRRDFVITQKLLGIPVVDVADVTKKGNCLFYRDAAGQEIPIHRIYNRIVPAEFIGKKMADKIQFRFTDDLDVEWVGDPAWFMKLSKYTMPFLKHAAIPKTVFLSDLQAYPHDLENYVLKPVFANAGAGVNMNVTAQDLDAIPLAEKHQYILMEKVRYAPFVPDLQDNMLNAEIRIILLWPDTSDKIEPVCMYARVMRGMDVNENLWADDTWCGMAPVMIVEEDK